MRSSPPLTLEWRRSRALRVVLIGLGCVCAAVSLWLPPGLTVAGLGISLWAVRRAWPRRLAGQISLDLQRGLRIDQGDWTALRRTQALPGVLILQAQDQRPCWLWQDMVTAADWCALQRWVRLQPWSTHHPAQS